MSPYEQTRLVSVRFRTGMGHFVCRGDDVALYEHRRPCEPGALVGRWDRRSAEWEIFRTLVEDGVPVEEALEMARRLAP